MGIATHIFLGTFHPKNLGKMFFYNLTVGIFVQLGWGKNPPTGEKVHPFRLEGSPRVSFRTLAISKNIGSEALLRRLGEAGHCRFLKQGIFSSNRINIRTQIFFEEVNLTS